jgi:hypothetical protein
VSASWRVTSRVKASSLVVRSECGTKLPSDVATGAVKVTADGPDADSQTICDRALVQILPIRQKDHGSLASRQPGDSGADLGYRFGRTRQNGAGVR